MVCSHYCMTLDMKMIQQNQNNILPKDKRKTVWPLFMDGVQIFTTKFPEFLVLISSTSEGLRAESTLEPLSNFKYGTSVLEIQRLNH